MLGEGMIGDGIIGQTLGHYQILEKLGEGGMGVVYKARDTRLNRLVALKILPPDKVADPERKRRFLQEAQAASALNHPNIVTIYDVNTSGETQFIAMEYISGKPLDHLIPRGGLPLNLSLKHAVEVAGALAKAHAAGIVHRDLKPGNIMVSDEGNVKLLDFGLAKLTSGPAGQLDATQTAGPAPRTVEGTIVGTVSYMSPEQAEGKKLDGRSDIFSFGAVLYEMVTGERAFQADSPLSTLAGILHKEPKPLREAVPGCPIELERIINRCLRKDSERRFQSMADLRVALQELMEDSQSGRLAVAPSAPTAIASPRRLGPVVWLAGLLIVGVIGAAVAWFFLRESKPTPESALMAVPFTTYPGMEMAPTFSPDGNQVAFSWNGEDGGNFDIYLKLIGPGKPLRLTSDPAPDLTPAWSPDGRSIAFVRHMGGDRAAVILIPALGGPERKLGDIYVGLARAKPITWSADGKYLIVSDQAPGESRLSLFRLSLDSGERIRLTTPTAEATYGDTGPAVSPDGKNLVFLRIATNAASNFWWLPVTADLKPAAEPKRLDTGLDCTTATWTSDSREIVFGTTGPRSGLWRLAVPGPSKPSPLPLAGGRLNGPAISRQGGKLVYAQLNDDVNIWSVDLARPGVAAGPARALIASTLREASPQFSPDSKKIAFSSNRSGVYEIWVCDRDGKNGFQLTTLGAVTSGSPRWSPDGKKIAFDSNVGGAYHIYVVDAEGGRPQPLTKGSSNDITPSWSLDGQWVYFGSNRTGRLEVWKIPAGGGNPVQITRQGGYSPFISSDGKTLYYVKGEGVTTFLLKVPVDGGEESQLAEGVHRYSFSVSKSGVYFSSGTGRGGSSALNFLNFGTGKISEVVKIGKPVDLGASVSPDERQVLFVQSDQENADLMLVENFH